MCLSAPEKAFFVVRFTHFQTDFQTSLAWPLLTLKKSKENNSYWRVGKACVRLSLWTLRNTSLFYWKFYSTFNLSRNLEKWEVFETSSTILPPHIHTKTPNVPVIWQNISKIYFKYKHSSQHKSLRLIQKLFSGIRKPNCQINKTWKLTQSFFRA